MATELQALEAHSEARKAAGELAEALKSVGITLPSLRGSTSTMTGVGHVELGGCSVETARKLTRIIKAGRP